MTSNDPPGLLKPRRTKPRTWACTLNTRKIGLLQGPVPGLSDAERAPLQPRGAGREAGGATRGRLLQGSMQGMAKSCWAWHGGLFRCRLDRPANWLTTELTGEKIQRRCSGFCPVDSDMTYHVDRTGEEHGDRMMSSVGHLLHQRALELTHGVTLRRLLYGRRVCLEGSPPAGYINS